MLNKIVWNGKYLLGINKIDAQHEHLFELVNKVLCLHDDNTKENVKELLYDFREYMTTHFNDEQEFMKSINYPQLDEHKLIHEDLKVMLNDAIRESGSLVNIKEKMKEVARIALVEHIIKEDFKVKAYVKHNLSLEFDELGNEKDT